MKQIFLAKRNGLLSDERVSLGVILLVITLIAFAMRLIAPNIFWTVVSPLAAVGDSIAAGTHSFTAGFSNAAATQAENERLTALNETLQNELSQLTQQLGNVKGLFADETSLVSRGLLAHVLMRPPESPYDTLLLDKGLQDGVIREMVVFGMDGTPLGLVESVSARYSRATLYSSAGMRTAAWLGQTSIPITLTGAGGGVYRASLPRSAGATVGDKVFIPQSAAPLGVVMKIDTEESTATDTLRIAPAANIFQTVSVELKTVIGAQFGDAATSTQPLP